MEMTDSVNATTQLMDDSELAQDPFPLYAQWREAGPIQHALTPSGDPVWLVTRYADVVAAFGDDRLSLSKTHSGTGYRASHSRRRSTPICSVSTHRTTPGSANWSTESSPPAGSRTSAPMSWQSRMTSSPR